MKIILLQDIENLGRRYEVKKVADGYAQNFLIPKGIVKPVTKKSLVWLEKQKEMNQETAEKELTEVQDLVSKIDGLEIMVSAKINKAGRLFGSITATKIIHHLKGKGFNIKKNQVELLEPIKDLGEWPIKISFPHGLEAEVRLIVSEEGDEIS